MTVVSSLATRYGSSALVEEYSWTESLTTTDATPTLFLSLPIAQNKSVTLYLEYDGRKSDYSANIGGYVLKKFIRGTGNISQQGASIDDILIGFNGTKPLVTVIANIVTQSIDITIVGLIATNLIWSANYYLKYNP